MIVAAGIYFFLTLLGCRTRFALSNGSTKTNIPVVRSSPEITRHFVHVDRALLVTLVL